MITQNTLLDFFTKSPSVSREKQLGVGVEKSSAVQFKDTFKSAVDKVGSSNTKKYTPGEEKNKVVNGKDERYNSYREAQAHRRRQETVNTVKDRSGKINKNDEDLSGKDGSEKQDSACKAKAEMYVDVIANILGINPGDLRTALESINVEPEELTDINGVSEAINKMSAALGLDEGQKQALADILKMLEEQMESRMGKQFPDESAQSGNSAKLTSVKEAGGKGSGTETDKNYENKPSGLNEIMASLKSKIEQLTQKLSQNPQELSAEFAEEIRNLMAQYRAQQLNTENKAVNGETKDIEGAEQIALNNPDDSQIKPIKAVKEAVSDAKDVKKDGEEADSGTVEGARSAPAQESKEGKQNVFQSINTNTNEGNNTEIGNPLSNNVQKSGSSENAAKVFKEVPVSKNEVFSQIIEKAKVVTNAGKSEIVMDLKPESLGKLSLKIVTEQGIVSAKFVAENQQVKEIIESNMQLLKDSLEKQGLSVQGFSVSVGQQSNGNSRKSQLKKDGTSEGRIEGVNAGVTVARVVSDKVDRVNPYNISENRINLTA